MNPRPLPQRQEYKKKEYDTQHERLQIEVQGTDYDALEGGWVAGWG